MGGHLCTPIKHIDEPINKYTQIYDNYQEEINISPIVIKRSNPISITNIKKKKKDKYGIICKECEDIFYNSNIELDYCSKKCKNKNKKICKNCHKIFYTKSFDGKCNITCEGIHCIIKKTCKRCGRIFLTKDKLSNYCSIKNCYHGTNCIDKVIKWLNYIANRDKIYIQHARNNGEFKYIINNVIYAFNGYNKETNTVYEFYTNTGHGNPNICDLNKIDLRTGKTYEELYNDTIKRDLIIRQHFNVVSIWEDEYDKLAKKIDL